MNIFVDIETIPAFYLDDADRNALVEHKVPKNFKVKATIDKWIEENAVKAYRDTALDPMKGRLITIAFAAGDEPVRVLHSETGEEEDERCLLTDLTIELADALSMPNVKWVAHNAAFDLRWLRMRACKYDNAVLRDLLPNSIWAPSCACTKQMWMGVDRQAKGNSLAAIAKYLELPEQKGGLGGAQVYDAWLDGEHDRIRKYCAQDVETLRSIYNKLGGF